MKESIDTSSPTGKLLFTLMSAIAQYMNTEQLRLYTLLTAKGLFWIIKSLFSSNKSGSGAAQSGIQFMAVYSSLTFN